MVRGRALAAAILAAAAAALAGCDRGGDAGKEEDGAESPEVPSQVLRAFPASTSGGLPEPARSVVKDGARWDSLWAQANSHLAPVPKAPPVDFSKEMVAFAALGRKATAGFSVEIVGAREEGGSLHVLFVERGPPAGAVVAQVETSPWHAVVLKRSDLPVVWDAYAPPPVRERKKK